MNRKITFPQLAEAMAQLTSGSPSTAESFIKHLFDLVAETLAKGESVTIKGIGTFTPQDNPESPVAWSPDKELADTVNEPFAFFEAVPLGDGVTEDTLEEANEVLDTTSGIEESTAVMPVIPPIPVSPVIPPIPKAATIATEEPEETAEEKAQDETSETVTSQESATEPEIMAQEATEVEEKGDESSLAPDDTEGAIETDYQEDAPRRFNPWLAFAIGVVTGALLYFITDRYIIPGEPPAEIAADSIATPAVIEADSAIVTADSVVEATDTIKRYQPIAVDTITTSRYLTTMARKYYGDYKFWVYIYEENSDVITNPNRIRPGTPVKIPDPEKYGIDANDPESLHHAEKKIGEITARLAK